MKITERKFMIIDIQGAWYALDLADIAEVADPSVSWQIPLVPPCFTGAMHFHGTIVATMDLALFLGLPKRREPEKIILLNQSVAALALLVDRIICIVNESNIIISECSKSCFSSFKLLLTEGEANLLDVAAIVKAAENMMN